MIKNRIDVETLKMMQKMMTSAVIEKTVTVMQKEMTRKFITIMARKVISIMIRIAKKKRRKTENQRKKKLIKIS